MSVRPDGSYQPVMESTEVIEISMRELSEATRTHCAADWFTMPYLIEIQGNGLAHLFSQNICSQSMSVEFEQGHPGISRVEATSSDYGRRHPMSLFIHRADTDWRFAISGSGLTTDKEARDLNGNDIATHPFGPSKPAITYSAKADTWLMTGTCKLVVGR